MIESLDAVLAAAQDLLARFLDPAQIAARPALIRGFRPQPDDYAKVFVGPAAERARAGYEVLWASPPDLAPRPGQTLLKVRVAMAEELGRGSPRGEAFPGGFEKIRQHLVPGNIWVAWRFFEPNAGGGMSYHGLVHLGGRFAWFPKPWKVLSSNQLTGTSN